MYSFKKEQGRKFAGRYHSPAMQLCKMDMSRIPLALVKYIKSYNRKELTALYGESDKTLRAWLHTHSNEIGNISGKRYTPRQVAVIFDKLGIPPKIATLMAEEQAKK